MFYEIDLTGGALGDCNAKTSLCGWVTDNTLNTSQIIGITASKKGMSGSVFVEN